MAIFLLANFFATNLHAGDSTIYTCRFAEDENGFSSIRMKKYFDPNTNMDLGKVDLIQNFMVIESTPTKVYQIPLLDNQTYVQFWHSPNLRVDTQLSYGHTGKFRANYTKNSERRELICAELRD